MSCQRNNQLYDMREALNQADFKTRNACDVCIDGRIRLVRLIRVYNATWQQWVISAKCLNIIAAH